MQSQLAVIMFADIVGYSAMMQADQEKTVWQVRALRETHLEPVVQTHGGRVLKRLGDGWIIAFGSISACVDCAMDVQRRMQSVTGVQLRIGCHFGDIVEEDEDIYGSGVNIAERIQAEAPPGGVMVSEDVVRQLSVTRAEDMKDAGVFRLKNISQPMRLYQWRPVVKRPDHSDEATSIAISEMEYAPQDSEMAAIAGDLRDQLFVRMSRRSGIVVYDGAAKDVRSATYDLRSRLRLSGGRGRLSLTLVLRADGRPVWSQSYDRSTEDIFDFCDVVLEQAEADLRLQTNAFDGDRLSHIPDEALSVSELRARAANLYYRLTYESWTHGRDLMNRALAMNPADGIAMCMRIEAEIMLAYARYEQVSGDLMDRFARDLDKAVEDLPGSDYVFWTRGTFRVHCAGDIAGARADLANTKRINPAYMEAHELEGHILMAEGNFPAASERFDLLLHRQTHNPMIPYRLFLKACALYCAERYDEAAREARHAADLRPRDRTMLALIAMASEAAGDSEAAHRYRELADQRASAPRICSRAPVVPAAQRNFVRLLARELSPH